MVSIAGCTAVPFSDSSAQERPVKLGLINSANVTHTFEVAVVELPANVTIRRPTGGDYTSDIDPGLSTHDPGDYHKITAVEFPESARLHGRFTLEPGETNESEITEFPTDFAVVVVIYHDDHVISRVSSTCDGTLVYFEVASRYDGSSSAYNCQGGSKILQLHSQT